MVKIEEMEVTPELLEAIEEQKEIEYRRANPPLPKPNSFIDYSEDITGEDLVAEGMRMIAEEAG